MSLNSLGDDIQVIELRLSVITREKAIVEQQLAGLTSTINQLNEQLAASYPIELSMMAQTHKVTAITLRESILKKVTPLQAELRHIESKEDVLLSELKHLEKKLRKLKLKKQEGKNLQDLIGMKYYD